MDWAALPDHCWDYAKAVRDGLHRYDPGPLQHWIAFAIVMAIFITPGYWLAGRLLGDARCGWAYRIVLGFACSLGLFALVGWPFLWLGGSFVVFLWVIGIVWAGYLLAAAYVCLRMPNGERQLVESTASAPRAGVPECGISLLLVLGYAAAAIALTYAWWTLRGANLPFKNAEGDLEPTWLALVRKLTGLLVIGTLLMIVARLALRRAFAFTSDDNRDPGLLSLGLAILFVSLQTFSAVIFDRPDWDDCFYLAAVLDYQDAEQLNDQEPTHREGFPVQAFDRLLAWELWGAVLCRLTGANPMVVFHTFLPLFLVPCAYLAYAWLLRECIPRRWVALAILGVAAYHLWGVASHNTPANFLLNRTAQGKSVLLHIGIPLMAALQIRLLRQPHWRNGACLVAAAVFALAASSSAVFLTPMLLACLGPALSPLLLTKGWRRFGVAAGFSVLAVVPAVAYGLLIRHEVISDRMIADVETIRIYELYWSWYEEVNGHLDYGVWEMLWVLLVPVTGLLLWNYRRLAYFLVFPAVLLATFSNPWLYNVVAKNLTSYVTYFRVLWLYPVAVGLGITLALTARLVGRTAEAVLAKLLPNAARGRAGPWLILTGDTIACFVVVSGVLASMYLPSLYVWGRTNVGMIQAHQRPRTPPVVDNAMKMPGDLLPLANDLLATPDLRDFRILTFEEMTNFLTPYSRDFRFVQTRKLYTLGMADAAGRYAEGEKRYLVSLLLDHNFWFQSEFEEPRQFFNNYYRVRGPMPAEKYPLTTAKMRALCDELKVRYAITYSWSEQEYDHYHTWRLDRVGFRPVKVYGEFTLWEREVGDGS